MKNANVFVDGAGLVKDAYRMEEISAHYPHAQSGG